MLGFAASSWARGRWQLKLELDKVASGVHRMSCQARTFPILSPPRFGLWVQVLKHRTRVICGLRDAPKLDLRRIG